MQMRNGVQWRLVVVCFLAMEGWMLIGDAVAQPLGGEVQARQASGTAATDTRLRGAQKESDQLDYDPRKAMAARQFNKVMSETAKCMEDAARVQLMTGERSRSKITDFQLSTCGSMMSVETDRVNQSGYGTVQPHQVEAMLRYMARQSLDQVLKGER